MVNVAREFLQILGAKDKFDSFGQPDFPEGYVQPRQDPLFPQPAAEIMARSIPISSDETKPVRSLVDVRIGPQTAFEIGWIGVETRNAYYKDLS